MNPVKPFFSGPVTTELSFRRRFGALRRQWVRGKKFRALAHAAIGLMLVCMLTASGVAVESRTAPDNDDTVAFSPEQLVAWCIVPFDSVKRTPEERAQMLNRLGITRVAYDWREEHVPQFEEEIRQYQLHGLELFAFWDWHDAIEPLLQKYDLHPQIWKTNPSPNLPENEQRVAAAAEQLLPWVEKSRRLGCQFGLYNHGGWGGEPEHLIAVCQHLREKHHAGHVGIVYNFHHGHDDIEGFADIFRRLQPYLLCVNLNGMASAEEVAADPASQKIRSVGQGKHEASMIRVIFASGYQGPIGIIGHRAERDVEVCLRESLDGLAAIVAEL